MLGRTCKDQCSWRGWLRGKRLTETGKFHYDNASFLNCIKMAATGEEASNTAADTIVTEYATYEDYLDSQITPTDLFYLEDEELARQLVELEYRGSGEVLKREDFELRKEAAAASKLARRDQLRVLCSAGKDLQGSVFLEGLAQREETNRNGKISSIIFIRDRNAKGQEISGYIDYAHRLKVDDFDPIFSSRKKLLPRHSDLSFYNWDTNFSSSNSTPNYQFNHIRR
ncbi:cilia- and flagella-associated protein 299-like [Halichondria panicea]|uniref:cilia- and flagella-associated protein 299-like n=1 Tax=Halichondria panicea TaxID=6063 RepID=UPI00312B38F8